MNISNLVMFCQVIEKGSISAAAKKKYISQPAVSKQIQQLENQYNTLLFNRVGNRLTPTMSGSILYKYAKEIIEQYHKSLEAVAYINGKTEFHLKIGSSPTIGEYILPNLLGVFTQKYQNIKINLSIRNTPEILKKLSNNIIEIALVEGISSEEKERLNRELKIEKFMEDELILITSRNHHWNKKGEINIEELVEEQMIWRESLSGTRKIIEKVLNCYGVLCRMEYFMELGSIQSIKNAVEKGLGISIVPRIAVKRELQLGLINEVKITEFKFRRDLYLVQKEERFSKIGIGEFVKFLKSKKYNN